MREVEFFSMVTLFLICYILYVIYKGKLYTAKQEKQWSITTLGA